MKTTHFWPFKKSGYWIMLLMLIGVLTAYAQPDPPDNPQVPISGIGYLLAIGGALGIKKIYDIQKKNHSE